MPSTVVFADTIAVPGVGTGVGTGDVSDVVSGGVTGGKAATVTQKTVTLRLGTGVGYGVFADRGTAPFRYDGLCVTPSVGLEFSGRRGYRTAIDIITGVGAFEDYLPPRFNFSSIGIYNTLRVKVSHHLTDIVGKNADAARDTNSRHRPTASLFWAAAATNFLNVSVNQNFDNASTGVSEFVGPELSLRAVASPFGGTVDVHLEIGAMPLAAVLRPGYSYIDNYSAANSVTSTIFSNHEWRLKALAGLSADVGLDIVTSGGGRLSVSYLWSYHTTGNSGYWRFDHATHTLSLDFYFNLKTKQL